MASCRRGRGRGRGRKNNSHDSGVVERSRTAVSGLSSSFISHDVPPPPVLLHEAARRYLESRAVVLSDFTRDALDELEEILALTRISQAGGYYSGWANAASYASACGLASHLDPSDLRHLPVILAHSDRRAVLSLLGLGASVQFAPRLETPSRPFPLVALGAPAADASASAPPPMAAASGVRLVLPDDL